MGNIHRAFYGERGGGHDLLSSTDPRLPAVLEAVGATDRPSASSDSWSPYVSGMPLGGHYVLMRTFPALGRAGGRGGFVFTHALFIEQSDVSAVSDLRVLFELLGTEVPPDMSLTTPFPSPGLVAPPEFPLDFRARAAARQLLAGSHANRPVVWLGEAGFEDLLARIWSGLWIEARMALRFRASFDPIDAERGALTLVCTADRSRARWMGFPTVDPAAAVDQASPAERLLAGESSPLSEFLAYLRPRAPTLGILRQTEAAAELLGTPGGLPRDRRVRLLRLLVSIGPDPDMAAEEKTGAVEHVAAEIGTSDASFTYSLRNIAEAPLGGAIESLRRRVVEWVRMHFTNESTAVGAWVHDGAQPWWIQSVWDGVEGAVRAWNREVAKALWSYWTLKPDTVDALCSTAAANGTDVEADFAATFPSTLAMHVAESVAVAARTHRWPVLFGLATAAAHGVEAAVEKILGTFSQDAAVALDVLGKRYGGAVLVESAVLRDIPPLTDVAALWIVRAPVLLAGVDPDVDGWRRVWLRAIEKGAAAWAGVRAPSTIRDRLLDRVLNSVEVAPSLLEALASTEFADLEGYPRRGDLWTVLPGPARTGFLKATASGWVARFRRSPESLPLPEHAVVSAARADPDLLAGDALNPVPALHAAVVAFDRLPGWQEDDLFGWLRRTGQGLSRLSPADAARLGRVVGERHWKRAAAELYSLRLAVPVLRAASGGYLSLLNIFQRWMVSMEDAPQGPHAGPDWYEALLDLAVCLYPSGPDHHRIWERSGGDPSRITGSSGRERWYSAVGLLRSGGGGKSLSPKRLTGEMVHDFTNNSELRSLHDAAP